MKKILLTSAGFENLKIGKLFLELVEKTASEIKILFIPTAARTDEELQYVEKSIEELLELGINETNMIIYKLDRKISDEELIGIDAIYVCGGNTFYLLHKIRESEFGEKIKELIENRVVYVGVSAGSIIMGPDIKIANAGKEWDINDIELKDLTGLNLTDKIISPHYTEKDKEIIEKFEKETGKKVTTLTDKEALLIKDEVRIIG